MGDLRIVLIQTGYWLKVLLRTPRAVVFSLLETGFSVGVTRFTAQFRARGQRAELKATVRSAVTLMAAAGVLAALVSVAMAELAPGLAASGETHDFQACMEVIGLAMIVRFPLAAFGAVLMGYQRYDLYNVSQTVTALSLLNDRATSTESVQPSIAPARSAATRACSSPRIFNCIEFMYGRPCFQNLVLRTYSIRSFGSYPSIR